MPLGRLASGVTVVAGQTLLTTSAFRTCGEVSAGWCNANGNSQGIFGTDSCAPMTVCCCLPLRPPPPLPSYIYCWVA